MKTKKPRKERHGDVIPAGEFRARCLNLVDEVRDRHVEIVITKYGKPVGRLVPVDEKTLSIFGYLRGTVTYHGDIVAPAGEAWEAEAGSV